MKAKSLEKHKYQVVSNTSPRRWRKPEQGWVKVNIDVAVFMESGCIGVGSIIRD